MSKIGLPSWVLNLAYKFIDVEKNSPTVDERLLEYSFAVSKIAKMEPGNLLDIGCVARMNLIVPVACELGWKVWGSDIRDYDFKHPNFTFIKGDIISGFPDIKFDAITLISTLEHIRVAGRYGIKETQLEGDKYTIDRCKLLLKDSGKLIITVPYGSPRVTNMGRTYSIEALDKLLGNLKRLDVRTKSNLLMLELSK